MTGKEFRRVMCREGLTCAQLIRTLGVSAPELFAWVAEEQPIPFWAVVGLGYMEMNLILGNPPERGVRKLLKKETMPMYEKLLLPLLATQLRPRVEECKEVVLKDGTKLHGVSAWFDERRENVYYVYAGGVQRVKGEQVEKLVAVKRRIEPGADDSGSSTPIDRLKANLKKILAEVNAGAREALERDLVLSWRLWMRGRLLMLQVSGGWCKLEVYARERLLAAVWELYVELCKWYLPKVVGASVLIHDKDGMFLGQRTSESSYVRGGDLHEYGGEEGGPGV